jgi:release factor glutamine methyltransferase
VTLHELVRRARATLQSAGIDSSTAALDAELLARHVLGWDRARWLSDRGTAAASTFASEYAALIERRRQREPIAYIRGVHEFWGREFIVGPGVLVPRPETELLVEAALDHLGGRTGITVVDVGTGTGCIAITLALEHPAARITATDVSPDALRVARENARRLGVPAIRFLEGSYLAGAETPVACIVSNPPYVAERDRATLPPEVQREPASALFAGEDGLAAIRGVIRVAEEALDAGGHLLLEIGHHQLPLVRSELAAVPSLGLQSVREDLQGIPRVLVIRRVNA